MVSEEQGKEKLWHVVLLDVKNFVLYNYIYYT